MATAAGRSQTCPQAARAGWSFPVHLILGQGLASTLVTEQPSLGIALLSPSGEESRKDDLSKLALPHPLTSAGKQELALPFATRLSKAWSPSQKESATT